MSKKEKEKNLDIDASLHRLPPQNLEAEQSILGGILLDNQSMNAALEILSPGDFYSEAHRKIFKAILQLSDRNEPSDLITLSNILKTKNELDQVGGSAYLASLVDNVPRRPTSPTTPRSFAKRLSSGR